MKVNLIHPYDFYDVVAHANSTPVEVGTVTIPYDPTELNPGIKAHNTPILEIDGILYAATVKAWTSKKDM